MSIEIQQASEELGNKYGSEAFAELCKKWGLNHNAYIEKIFIAGFMSGSHAAMTMVIESGKEK